MEIKTTIIKRRIYALITVLVMLLNMFSPYGIIMHKVYAEIALGEPYYEIELLKPSTDEARIEEVYNTYWDDDEIIDPATYYYNFDYMNDNEETIQRGVVVQVRIKGSSTVNGGNLCLHYENTKIIPTFQKNVKRVPTLVDAAEYSDFATTSWGMAPTEALDTENSTITLVGSISPTQISSGKVSLDDGEIIATFIFKLAPGVDIEDLDTTTFSVAQNQSVPTGIRIPYFTDYVGGTQAHVDGEEYLKFAGFAQGEKKISGITISKNPTKNKYYLGETLNLSDGEITVSYDDGTNSDPISISSAITSGKLTIDTTVALNTKKVTLTYEGKTTEFNYYTLDSIAVKNQLNKMSYEHDETIQFEGGELTAAYKNAANETLTETLNIKDEIIEGKLSVDRTIAKIDEETITFTYYNNKTATITLTVTDPIDRIVITKQPTKTEWNDGDTINFEGGEITPYTKSGKNGTPVAITDSNVTKSTTLANISSIPEEDRWTKTDGTQAGKQTITLSYQGKTADLELTVNDTIASITITTQPTQKNKYGTPVESLNFGGIVATATTTGGATITLGESSLTIDKTGYNQETIDMQEFIVKYGNITATNKAQMQLTNYIIGITANFTEVEFNYGTKLNDILTNGTYVENYANGTSSEQKTITSDMVIGYIERPVAALFENTIYPQTLTIRLNTSNNEFDIIPATTTQTIITKDVVNKVEMKYQPTKKTYNYGEEFENGTGTIEITYESGKTSSISISNSKVSLTEEDGSTINMRPDKDLFENGVTKKTIKVTYTDNGIPYETSFEITIKDIVKAIKLTTTPKTQFNYADPFVTIGGKITVTYESGKIEEKDLNEDWVTEQDDREVQMSPNASEYLTGNICTKTLKVTYEGQTDNYEITIINTLEKIELVGNPKTQYNVNEEIQKGISVKITRKVQVDGVSDVKEIEIGQTPPTTDTVNPIITGFDTSTEGTVTAIITYIENGITKTVNYEYTVTDSVTAISIHTAPKNEQKYGEELDLTGAKINVVKGSNTEQIDITPSMIKTGTYDKNTLGEQTVTVQYGTKLDGTPITTTFKVTVQDYIKEIVLNKSEITGKYNDELADLIDNNELTYKIVYAKVGESAAKKVTTNMIDGYNKQTLEEQNLIVKYIDTEEGTYKNASNEYTKPIKITLAKEINKIEITAPSKTEYGHGEGFDLSGGEIIITYTDTSTATRTMTTSMIYENDGTTIANLTPTSYNSTNKVAKTLKIKYEEDGKIGTVDYPVTIINTLEKIELVGNPKTQYNINEEIQKGISVKITRKVQVDGVSDVKEIEIGQTPPTTDTVNPIIIGFDTSTEGTVTAIITYIENGVTKTVNYEYTVTDNVTAISIHTAPKNEQKYGEELDLTGAKINVVKGSNTEQIDITPSMIKTGTYDKNTLGEQTVTVQYGTKPDGTPITTTFKVTVQDYVKSVTIVPPSKVEYQYNTNLDLSDSKIIKIMASTPDKPQTIQVTQDMILGYDKTQIGTQTVTITYTDDKTYTQNFVVTVTDAINNIELIDEGFKTQYLYNENLDVSALKLKVTYTGGNTKIVPVTTSMINNYNPKKLGIQNITVKYEIFEKDITVTVKDYIKDIELTLPTKKEYNLKEQLDLTGGNITTVMASGVGGVTIPLTQGIVTGFDSTTPGAKTITVTYEGKSKTFQVIVIGPTEEDSVKEEQFKEPNKKEYKIGDTIDLAGGNITQIMTSGKIVTIDLTNDMIMGFDSTTPGTKTITVSYNGKNYTYNINVKDETLGISIQTLPNKLEYKKGENLEVTGATLNIIKLSGIETINITKEMISGYDNSREGTQVISVNYEGFIAQFSITVKREDKETNTPSDNKPNNNKPSNNKPNKETTDKVIDVPAKEEKEPIIEETEEEINEEPILKDEEEITNNKEEQDEVVPVIGTTNNDQTPPTSGKFSKQNMLYLLVGILSILGISLIIVIIEKRKKNVKIYLEEGGQKVLVGKEKVSKKYRFLDLNKYYDEYKEDKYQIVLSKSINKKLDQKSVNLIVHDKKESFVVNSNNESCSYRI